jgi:hypothetical protein
MRILLCLTLLLGLATARAQGERNPFAPPRAPDGAPAHVTAPRLPDVRPGPYLPPPPSLPPPLSATPQSRSPSSEGNTGGSAVPAVPAKPGAFLSRENIEAARQRCRVGLESHAPLHVPATGAQLRVALKIDGGPGCVKALQSDAVWLHADLDETRVVVRALANPGPARRARVFIANVGTSLSLQVEQDAAPGMSSVDASGGPGGSSE